MATVGVDLADNDAFHVCRLNECPNSGGTARVGNVSDSKRNARNFSAKLNSTASWTPRPWANLKTTIGADYANIEGDSLAASGRGLAPGASSLGAVSTFVSMSATTFSAQKTLGYYFARTARVARATLPHRRDSSGPEQRFRDALSEHQIPEAERVVAAVGRVVFPAC